MDEQFYAAYGRRFYDYEYAREPFADTTRNIVRDAIEEAAHSIRPSIRPDAAVFLLVNIHQLIVLPLVETQREPTDEIFSSIRDDVDYLLKFAGEMAVSRGEEVISGHIMVDALSYVWDRLKLTQAFYWFE
jgi:hypothetical protein